MATLTIRLRDREIQRVVLQRQTMRVGRDETNDIIIDNAGVSRLHATIRYSDGGFYVQDEGSQNGIFVNGKKVERLALQHDDVIQVGKFSLTFDATAGPAGQAIIPDRAFSRRKERPAGRASFASANPQETMALSPNEIDKFVDNDGGGAAPLSPAERALRRQRKVIAGLLIAVLVLGGAVLYFMRGTS